MAAVLDKLPSHSKRSRPEIGFTLCRFCRTKLPVFKGRKAGGLFYNCTGVGGCGARVHLDSGSRSRALVVEESGIKE